jgi:hypothetical protein
VNEKGREFAVDFHAPFMRVESDIHPGV